MSGLFFQLIINLIFSKFYNTDAWKWYKYSALVVFPVLTMVFIYFKRIEYRFGSNIPETFSMETSSVWRVVLFGILSLGIQLVLNNRFENRKENIKT